MSKPVGYYDGAFVTVRPGPRHTPGLRVSDVPLSWARQHLNPRGPDQPLDRVRLFWAGDVRPGQRELTFTLPIRRDHLREGVEHVTVQVRLLHARARGTSTVQVLDALPR